MSRTLSTPLTAEDVEFLRERVPEAQVARLIELNGVEASETEPEAEPTGEATGDVSEAGDGSEKDGDEDLIGGPTFDPTEFTEDEISAYLDANPDDKERVLALESEGKQRKGVLAL